MKRYTTAREATYGNRPLYSMEMNPDYDSIFEPKKDLSYDEQIAELEKENA